MARAECRQPVSGWECGLAGVLGEMDEAGRTRDSERQRQSQIEKCTGRDGGKEKQRKEQRRNGQTEMGRALERQKEC